MSERTIENVRKYNLDPKEVITGLNGYYESDKRNSYITVRRNDVEGPVCFTAALYLSALIEWLREDYDIFYYPGMDIRDSVEPGLIFDQVEAAKMCCLKDIMNYIRQESSRNGFDLPKEIDDEPLTVKRIFHDLLELLVKRTAEIREVDDYKLSLKDYILHDIKKRGYRYNGLETKSIEDIVDWIITMATLCANKSYISDRIHEICNAKGVELDDAFLYGDDYTWEDVQKETKQECYDYLWNALNKLSPECDALKIDQYEELVDRIFYEMSLVTENCKQCQKRHSIEKLGYIRRANKAEEEVKELNDVIKRLKELLNEINKEEDNEWFKP